MHEASDQDDEIVGTARIEEGADGDGNDRRVRVIWASGFFDGEGSISLPKTKNGTRGLRISVGQLHLQSLQILKELWGGSIAPETMDNGKTLWRWNALAHDGAAALRDMLPLLVVKQEQAELALEFWDGRAARAKVYQDKRHRGRVLQRRYRNGEKSDRSLISEAQALRRDTESKRGDEFMRRIAQSRL